MISSSWPREPCCPQLGGSSAAPIVQAIHEFCHFWHWLIVATLFTETSASRVFGDFFLGRCIWIEFEIVPRYCQPNG
jgi:hypothetical protein